jgi:Spy/CpxP family protein refolding chaperone
MNEQTNEKCTHQTANSKLRRHSKGFRFAVLLAVVAGIGATAVWAGNHGFGPGPWDSADRMQHGIERMAKHLDLSAEQRTSIEAIVTASRAAAAPYREQLSILRGDLRELVEADEYYEEQVRIMLDARAADMVELMVIGTRTIHDVRAELTSEQRVEVDEMLERMLDKAGPRRFGRHHDEPDIADGA